MRVAEVDQRRSGKRRSFLPTLIEPDKAIVEAGEASVALGSDRGNFAPA